MHAACNFDEALCAFDIHLLQDLFRRIKHGAGAIDDDIRFHGAEDDKERGGIGDVAFVVFGAPQAVAVTSQVEDVD
jgi:hypothetical protein